MKTILVTGAAKGIGRATVMRLHRRGMNVIFTYNHSEERANELLKMIEEADNAAASDTAEVRALRCNLADAGETAALFKANKDLLKQVDVLVNNAGMISNPPRLFMMSGAEDWRKVFDNNVNCVVNTTRNILPYFIRKRGGRIINICSLSGIGGDPGQSAYAASKAAIANLSKSLNKELAQFGIIVNCVAPGLIETDMTREVTGKYAESILAHTMAGRMGTADEVANLVEYLALDAPDYLINQQLVIAGGL